MSDHALPSMPMPIDRRKLTRLVLAGATGAALAEAGIPVSALTDPIEGPKIEIESLHRTVQGLTVLYDNIGPAKVSAAVKAGQARVVDLMSGRLTPAQQRETTVIYGRLLALDAWAGIGAARYDDAERNAKLAAHTAVAVGDSQTAGQARAMMSGAAGATGRPHHALVASRRAHAAARSGPSVVQASLAEAQAAAWLPRGVDRQEVLGIVRRAEAEHAELPRDKWGSPGGPLGTYSPVDLRLYGADALIDVGLFADARERLAEAAELLGEQDGLLRAYLWLQEARAAFGYGDLDEAHEFASLAVASAESRPAGWVGRILGRLNDASKATHADGYFTDLVERADRWRYTA